MFDRIAGKIKKAGFHDAFTSVISAGMYFDGKQHGELFPCVHVSVDVHEVDYNRRPIEKAMKSAIRNLDNVIIRPCYNNPYYYTYFIARREDFERADELNKVSRAFHEGFWQAIHEQGDVARANNAALAIQAGHAAMQAAGF
jgi:hypothetical protein